MHKLKNFQVAEKQLQFCISVRSSSINTTASSWGLAQHCPPYMDFQMYRLTTPTPYRVDIRLQQDVLDQ